MLRKRNGPVTDIDLLMAEISAEMRETAMLTGKASLSPKVAEAMRAVAREAFVPSEESHLAYINRPLPIGHGQTISQPFVVALMTQLLDPGPDDVVLEVGTGSGYQTAILAKLAGRVYSIEVVPDLATAARERLQRLGYDNVEVRQGDGAQGWPEHAPYDGIIVTAAAPEIPPALIAQLKPGGRLVIPEGRPYARQDLIVATKGEDGKLDAQRVLPVAFVPLTGR